MHTPSPDTQLCVTCDKQIANFFKTCPFCKNKIAKPLAEKTPTATDGGAINPWTGAPDKPTPKVQKSETYRDKPLVPVEQNASRLTECRDCGHAVSKFAKACPGCGSAAFSHEATVQKGTTACSACASQVALTAKQCPSCGTRDFLKPADGFLFWFELLYRGLMFTAGGIMLYGLVRCSAAVID